MNYIYRSLRREENLSLIKENIITIAIISLSITTVIYKIIFTNCIHVHLSVVFKSIDTPKVILFIYSIKIGRQQSMDWNGGLEWWNGMIYE